MLLHSAPGTGEGVGPIAKVVVENGPDALLLKSLAEFEVGMEIPIFSIPFAAEWMLSDEELELNENGDTS